MNAVTKILPFLSVSPRVVLYKEGTKLVSQANIKSYPMFRALKFFPGNEKTMVADVVRSGNVDTLVNHRKLVDCPRFPQAVYQAAFLGHVSKLDFPDFAGKIEKASSNAWTIKFVCSSVGIVLFIRSANLIL